MDSVPMDCATRGVRLVVVWLLFLSLLVIAAQGHAQRTVPLEKSVPGVITLEQYQAIQLGMSYAEVLGILGQEGTVIATNGQLSNYVWHVPPGSLIMIAFVDGRVEHKLYRQYK